MVMPHTPVYSSNFEDSSEIQFSNQGIQVSPSNEASSSGGIESFCAAFNSFVVNDSLDAFDFELAKLRKDEVNLKKDFEEKTSKLMDEWVKKEMDDEEYDRKYKELDAAYKAAAVELETMMSKVRYNGLLAEAFRRKIHLM